MRTPRWLQKTFLKGGATNSRVKAGQDGNAEGHRAYWSVCCWVLTLMLSDQRRSRLRLAMDLLREPYYHWVVFRPQPSPRCSQRVRQSLRTSWP